MLTLRLLTRAPALHGCLATRALSSGPNTSKQLNQKEQQKQSHPPSPQPQHAPSPEFGALGIFGGLCAVSVAHDTVLMGSDWSIVMGSLGASSVLVFGLPSSPLSQPRNVLMGHSLAAVCGLLANKWVAVPMESAMIAGPLAVSVAFYVMQKTKSLHPPAGGTALAIAMDTGMLQSLDWMVLAPTAWGSSMIVALGVAAHSFRAKNSYPLKWF